MTLNLESTSSPARRDIIDVNKRRPWDIVWTGDIVSLVAEEFGVRTEAILGNRRFASVTLARHVAIYMVRKTQPNRSYPWLAWKFGYGDHTSALHADRRIKKLVGTDSSFAARLAGIERAIQAEAA